MISVVLLSHNTLQTNKCIDSLKNENHQYISEIIVLNSLSKESTYKSDNITIKYLPIADTLSSFSHLCNLGIKNTNNQNDILIMNDNCYFVDNALSNLQKALDSNNNIGIATPITNIGPIYHYQSLELPFDNIEIFKQYLGDKTVYNEDENEVRLRTAFLTTLIKREVFNEVGLFDETFVATNYVSDDFCLRSLKKGYKTLFCNHSFVFIEGGLYYNIPTLDQEKFKEKWGIDSRYSLSIRNDILSRLAIDTSKSINILEVGCACGSTLLKLKNIYKDANLYGIDIDKNSVEIAKCIDGATITSGDIENNDFNLEENKFDLIIALDVIEHLKDPWKILEKFKNALKEDGQILISIPNIMHISIINNLIQGRWDYEECGILDKTHLRFFTLKSINEMFQNIDCNKIYYFSIYSNLSLEEKNLISLLASQYNIDKMQLMSYQYIVTNKAL